MYIKYCFLRYMISVCGGGGRRGGGQRTRGRSVCVFMCAGEHLSFCLPQHVYRPMMYNVCLIVGHNQTSFRAGHGSTRL